MELAGRCDIDGVKFGGRKYGVGIGVDLRNRKFIRAPGGILAGGIGDRDHARPIWDVGPRDEVMAAHHAGADQANAGGLAHGRSGRVMPSSQHA